MSKFDVEVSVSGLFNGVLFRIPDYQRGYSWGKKQLDDMWEDVTSLSPDQKHYTGLITLSEGTTEDLKWTGFKTLKVVDGQQRLTTIIIAIKTIINRAEELGSLDIAELPIPKIVERYLYLENPNNKQLKASIFGYEKGDPSDEFFQSKILSIQQPTQEIQTAYTYRLLKAYDYFLEKVKEFDEKTLSDLFVKITESMIFNKYVVSDPKEVSIIFESMNNRGKQLSTLELLKNRLMYLSEKLNITREEKSGLRENINKCWKIIYEWLGKSKKILDDDDFLKAHWIMYFKYKREKSKAFAIDILNEQFSIKKAYKNEITYKDIDKYINSLSAAVKHWFYMNHTDQSNYAEKLKEELARLGRVGYILFEPLILGLLMKSKEEDFDSILRILKKSEEFIFKVFYISRSPSNTGDSEFYRMAGEFYKGNITTEEILSQINSKLKKHFGIEEFSFYIEKQFRDNGDGFYSWDGIDYFLFEYDTYLEEKSKGGAKAIDWDAYQNPKLGKAGKLSIEHIFPQNDSRECWQKIFEKFTQEEKQKLNGSLGNLVPLSIPRNSSFQNKCFVEKKNDGKGCGYYNGSYSEAEINGSDAWTANEILERGLKLLDFMEERWHIVIDDKEKLLHLDFLKKTTV